MCHHRQSAEWEAIRERHRERREEELDDGESETDSPDEERSDGPTAPTPPADD